MYQMHYYGIIDSQHPDIVTEFMLFKYKIK